MKKIFIILNILSLFILTGCESSKDINYNSEIRVNGPVLKISLIQTAHEIYNTNIENSYKDLSIESIYSETSIDSKKHYKWLNKTYSSIDEDMKNRLKNIFDSNSSWNYLNSVIELNDDANIYDIVNTINSDESLNLSSDLKNDIELFFNYFYDEHFKSYFNKNKYTLNKKASKLNNLLYENDVDIAKFIENVTNIKPNKDYVYTFYYSLNPISYQNFEYDNNVVSTISESTNVKDLLKISFHKYSHDLFDTFTDSPEFLNVCDLLRSDDNLVSLYKESDSHAYNFNDWCEENLIEGFSKYLDYRYSQYEYDFSNFVYDLDFYNYLKDINFNPDKITLEDASIEFYKKFCTYLIFISKDILDFLDIKILPS
ncbi:hypothetical protein [Romboutsia sp. 13368]|uniref:hypothetical protein n=1 Tax=Romboutsia sp. 13368 TaxID=2708053 RepID=UPI0025DCDFBC|nr:hypothetical protein [Romboutsia sp. 13368]